jgi:class 3 adenylate cyclase/tetratricopeptide (TPR) repeat protein
MTKGTRQPPDGAERKVVTVLFADVDETVPQFGERDPEDVGRMLAGHLERARAEIEIESYGGTVEQVVGGTTIAVFGVPRTREDDPERAVRAALAIRDALLGERARAGPGARRPGWGVPEVRLRVAITTGKARVRTGPARRGPVTAPEPPQPAGPGRVTGDLVTTCARIQQAAPPGAILVSDATERLTRRAIAYGGASLLALESRDEPVAVWPAIAPLNIAPTELGQAAELPLVGREHELALLLEHFIRVRTSGRPQLVTLLGDAGMGKSRLVAELRQAVAGDLGPVAWRHGRSLPYGDGVTFWALSEIVKAEAGILETDTAERAERKLAAAARFAMAGDPAGAAWVTEHLRLLVGAGEVALMPGGREEALAAWRRFLYGLAARRRALVLVVEDLHWADYALLDFLDKLTGQDAAGQPGPLPLLVLATARPELEERWPLRAPASTVPLGPLSDIDTSNLLERLLARYRLPATVGPELLALVGGNPLFAEEYVHMLRDHGSGQDRRDALGSGREAGLPGAMPESVHAIIAARLDALAPDEKAVLQDAAVLGRVGWVGALAAIGGHDEAWLEDCLERLERKEFVHQVKRSSVAGERQYGFRHVLVRDVAYEQIPRVRRAERHRRAASWIESLAAAHRRDRAENRAELLAHHYQRALAFGQASGHDDADLPVQARLALRDAGDRAAALGVYGTAARWYSQALELWPPHDSQRPELLLRAGRAAYLSEGGGEKLLTEARDALLAAGERGRAAEAEMFLGRFVWLRGRGEERLAHVERALDLVADAPPSRSKLKVLNEAAGMLLVGGTRRAEALAAGKEALAMAEELGQRDLEAGALGIIGLARIEGGDENGTADLERAVALCDVHGSPYAIRWRVNLAYAFAAHGDLARCFHAQAAAWRVAERFGALHEFRWLEAERVAEAYWTGSWDEASGVADEFIAEAEGGEGHYLQSWCRLWRGRIRLARGEIAAALADAAAALRLARETTDAQNVRPAQAFQAAALLADGRAAEARTVAEELLGGLGGLLEPALGADFGVVLRELGYEPEVLDGVVPSPWLAAAKAMVADDPLRAAGIYAAIGSRPDEAVARQRAARRLLETRHPAEAEAQLDRALAFWREVGASAQLRAAASLVRA